MHKVIDGLKKLKIDIGVLSYDPVNARSHSERNLEAIKASLNKFGQRKPIVVQKEGMVVRAGNGTLEAAKRLGWTEIAAVVIDEDNLSATSFAIADNRTGDLSDWDYNTLGLLLKEIKDGGEEDLTDLGWTSEELDVFLAENTFDLGLGDEEDSGSAGFADTPQFKAHNTAVFIIEASPELADDAEFKSAIDEICTDFDVSYKVRLV